MPNRIRHSYKVIITLGAKDEEGNNITTQRRFLAVNKQEAIKECYQYNYNIQEDISKYEIEEPVFGLVPR